MWAAELQKMKSLELEIATLEPVIKILGSLVSIPWAHESVGSLGEDWFRSLLVSLTSFCLCCNVQYQSLFLLETYTFYLLRAETQMFTACTVHYLYCSLATEFANIVL